VATAVYFSNPQAGSDPVWVKKLIGGSLLAVIFFTGAPLVRQLFARRQKINPKMSSRFRTSMLRQVRASVLGKARHTIREMLGPPSAMGTGRGTTWYYPLDSAHRVAMAILFDHDHVRDVEFLDSPQ
jgi:outer membrane protein assembly factor BamE (lipoprotein component of BamABCDE complex)